MWKVWKTATVAKLRPYPDTQTEIEIRRKCKDVPVHAITVYAESKVQLHSFPTTAPAGGE